MVSLFDVKEIYVDNDVNKINEMIKTGEWVLIDSADGKELDGEAYFIFAIGKIK